MSGYKINCGTVSGSHSLSVDVGNKTSHTLQRLTEGVRYDVVVVDDDANRVEGNASTETSGCLLAGSAIATNALATNSAVVSWQTNNQQIAKSISQLSPRHCPELFQDRAH